MPLKITADEPSEDRVFKEMGIEFSGIINIFVSSVCNRNQGLTTNCRKPSIEMVRPRGVEPPTYGTGIRHSIQLSYGRIFGLIFSSRKKWMSTQTGLIVIRFLGAHGHMPHGFLRFLASKFADAVQPPHPPLDLFLSFIRRV